MKNKAPKMRPIPDYGHHMTMKDWISCVEEGGFIDYDGFGYYATKTEETDIMVIPSDVDHKRIDKRWTHIVWYNR